MAQKFEGELYPLVPLRDIVIFPHMIAPLFIGREKTARAIEEAVLKHEGKEQTILMATQKDANLIDPTPEDIYRFGVIGNIMQVLKLPDGTVKVLVRGTARAVINGFSDNKEFLEAYAQPIQDISIEETTELKALRNAALGQFETYVKLNKRIPPEIVASVAAIEETGQLADTLAAHLSIKTADRQAILQTLNVFERLEQVYKLMQTEIGLLQVERRIRGRVQRQMEKTQRDYYLTEQLKAIQKELGEGAEGREEVGELEKKIKEVSFSKEAREKVENELKKLKGMSPMSAEATVVRNYLDWMVSIPWNAPTPVKKDIKLAEKVLNEDHYGLEKVKERILEYLAVQHRVEKVKGPILCLVGPPGVGKTSLGKSIARATGRNFVRMSLGGIHDEAEIRGHRRTYIGSMPGRIVQGMKKAKSSNPLFLLDEVDKLSADWRGDPSSALLEVLDPEQNSTFNDNYLEVDYDLSDVMFVCTANSLNMPQPLLDRMEIIRLAGYTEDEKVAIAKGYLIDKQMIASGIKKKEFSISDDALRDIIRYYTREAGVRNLEREIANLARKAVKEIVAKKAKVIAITSENLDKYAGVRKFTSTEIEKEDLVGVTTGLAWTEVGGELLSVEAITLLGKGKITITGKLGDVMKESVQAAESYVKARATEFGINPDLFEKRDIHVHVPEGATPKDGPSAGVAMVTSIVSVLTGIPVKKDVAMTGEITLRGRVLPIGGLKEKLLAALRGGLKVVLIPEENAKDLVEIPDNVKKGLKIITVSKVDEVLSHALVRKLTPITWTESQIQTNFTQKSQESGHEGTIQH